MGLGSSALVLDIVQCPQLPTDTLWAMSGGAGHILLSCCAHPCSAPQSWGLEAGKAGQGNK